MNNVVVNSHLFMFNIVNGEVFLILEKKERRLSIPKILYPAELSLEKQIMNYIGKNIHGNVINLDECHIYSKNNIIDIIYVILLENYKFDDNYKVLNIKDVDSKILPDEVKNYLKEKIKNINFTKKIYKDSFSLSELKRLLENIYNIKLDRRNFRKRYLNLKIVTETNETKKTGGNGRPNKLYKFNDNIDINLI